MNRQVRHNYQMIEAPPIPIPPPAWFQDEGFSDLVERLLVVAALIDIHVGCLIWLGSNANIVGSPERQKIYREQVYEDAESLTDLSVALSQFAAKILDREELLRDDVLLGHAVDVLDSAVNWIVQLKAILAPGQPHD